MSEAAGGAGGSSDGTGRVALGRTHDMSGAMSGGQPGAQLAVVGGTAAGGNVVQMHYPWDHLIQKTPKGVIRNTLVNAEIIMGAPGMENMFALDVRQQEIMVLRSWPHTDIIDYRDYPRYWEEEYDAGMARKWLERIGGLYPNNDMLGVSAAYQVAQKRPMNFLRDRLDRLPVWDGFKRLELVPTEILGTVGELDIAIAGMFFSKWMIGAVARALNPGCQMDTMLILEGGQGIGKTSLFRLLALDLRFYVELENLDYQKALGESIRGKWIVGLSELSALYKYQLSNIKASLSRTQDTYRPAYARKSRDFPRNVVFAGCTNEYEYLRDPTGARRFWPVKCGKKIDLKKAEAVVELLWAEALARYLSGERWWLNQSEDLLAAQEQNKRRDLAFWEEIAEDLFSSYSVGHVLPSSEALRILKAKCPQEEFINRKRLAGILRECGWEAMRDTTGNRTGTRGGRMWQRTMRITKPGE